MPWGPSCINGLSKRVGPVETLIALPSHLLEGEQPAVGHAQLLLETGHVFFQLLSSLDPLKNSASLSLGGVLGGAGELPGAFRAMEPPCFHGKSGLWACLSVVALCVRPGSGHPAAGPASEAVRGVMVCSASALILSGAVHW